MNYMNREVKGMLTEQQLQCIDYLAQGNLTIKEVSDKIRCSERAIYKWKKNEEFIGEAHKRADEYQRALAEEGRARMVSKGAMALDNIIKLANKATSEKVLLDANVFIWENIYGKSTTRIADVTESEIKRDEFIKLDELLDE